jgi:hypothetical protein
VHQEEHEAGHADGPEVAAIEDEGVLHPDGREFGGEEDRRHQQGDAEQRAPVPVADQQHETAGEDRDIAHDAEHLRERRPRNRERRAHADGHPSRIGNEPAHAVLEEKPRLVQHAQRIRVPRRIRAQRRKLREVVARVFVEGLAQDLAVAQVEDQGRDGHDRRDGGSEHRDAPGARTRDEDVDRHGGERREDRMLLRHHRERVTARRQRVEQRPLLGGGARDEPQGEDREKRGHQDRPLDQVGHRVDRHRVQGEERDGDAERGGTIVGRGRGVASSRIVARRLDMPQDLAVQRPQREHDADVDREVHEPLLPQAVAHQGVRPDEGAVRQHAGVEVAERTILLEERPSVRKASSKTGALASPGR